MTEFSGGHGDKWDGNSIGSLKIYVNACIYIYFSERFLCIGICPILILPNHERSLFVISINFNWNNNN